MSSLSLYINIYRPNLIIFCVHFPIYNVNNFLFFTFSLKKKILEKMNDGTYNALVGVVNCPIDSLESPPMT